MSLLLSRTESLSVVDIVSFDDIGE